MENKRLYTINIKSRKEPIVGIVEYSSLKWIVIKKITNDYIFDGFSLIQRCHVKSCKRTKDNKFTEKVLAANGIMDIITPQIPIENRLAPFKWLYSQQEVAEFWIVVEDTSFVGKVNEVKTIILHYTILNSCGKWLTDIYTLKIRDIVFIDINTDYILSLLTYNQSRIWK